jgi:two-component system, NarL family, invasion response regulator UvrY
VLRVIALDNQPIALKGLQGLVQEGFPDSVVEGVATGREILDRVEDGNYDLAIIDVVYSDMDGLEVLAQIRKRKPGLPVLVLSELPEERYAMRVIKAGGNGYITKQSTCEELLQATRKVLAGKRYVSPAFAEKVVFDFESRSDLLPHEKLSNRELQVAFLIGRGKTVKAINEELQLSINTVRTYRARILRKIGLRGTNELIHYVAKHLLSDR